MKIGCLVWFDGRRVVEVLRLLFPGGMTGTCGDGTGDIKGSSDDGGTCGDGMGGVKGSSDDGGGMDRACGDIDGGLLLCRASLSDWDECDAQSSSPSDIESPSSLS